VGTLGRLQTRVREHHGALLVEPVGLLDLSSYPDLRDCLIKCATEGPSAVVVDVDRLSVGSVSALSVFSTVWMQVSEWPGVPLVLVATDAARRAGLVSCAVARFVPVYPSLDAALWAIGRPPHRRRDRLTLPGIPRSSAVGRRFVRRLCDRWGVASLADDAAAVTTELIENVVLHTDSVAELRLELRGSSLSVAVSDTDPRLAVLREAVSRAAPSPGLAIVAKLARVWGCTPTADGKIVWAVLAAA